MNCRRFVAAIALLGGLVRCVATLGDEPVAPKSPRAIVCQVRLLEGDPHGRIEKGTIRVLAEPTVTTLEGREANFQTGGTLASQSKGEVFFGTRLTVNPKRLGRGKCEATLAIEVSEPIKKDGDGIVAAAGNTMRASGVFSLGVPTAFTIKELGDGKKMWLEVTFDSKESQPRLPSAEPRLPSAGYIEIPSTKAPTKSRQR